jgi:hypothetical protein
VNFFINGINPGGGDEGVIVVVTVAELASPNGTRTLAD